MYYQQPRPPFYFKRTNQFQECGQTFILQNARGPITEEVERVPAGSLRPDTFPKQEDLINKEINK